MSHTHIVRIETLLDQMTNALCPMVTVSCAANLISKHLDKTFKGTGRFSDILQVTSCLHSIHQFLSEGVHSKREKMCFLWKNVLTVLDSIH